MVEKSSSTIFIGKVLNFFGLIFPGLCSKILIKAISHPRKGRLKDFQIKYLGKHTNQLVLEHNGEKIAYYEWNMVSVRKPIPATGNQDQQVDAVSVPKTITETVQQVDEVSDRKPRPAMPTILLCHGWESNSHRWKKFVSYMKESEYHFVSLDAPGHGRSFTDEFTMVTYGEYIKTMIETFNPTYIVAHSVGSFCSLYALFRLPQYAHIKIICLSGPPSAMFVMERVFHLLDLNARMQRIFIKTLEKKFKISIKEVDIKYIGPLVKNQGILIYDKADFVNPIECGETIHENWKNSTYKVIEGYDHSMRHVDVYGMVMEYLIQN